MSSTEDTIMNVSNLLENCEHLLSEGNGFKNAVDKIIEKDSRCSEKGSRLSTEKEFLAGLERIKIKDMTTLSESGPILFSDKIYAYYPKEYDGHTFIGGPSGSLKTTYGIIPYLYTIARSGESAVISDCKGELYDKTNYYFQQMGYQILKIDLRDTKKSKCWNPLEEAFKMYKSGDPDKISKSIRMVSTIGDLLCPTTSFKDPWWDQAGAGLMKGAMVILFEICKKPEQVTIRNLIYVLAYIKDNEEEFKTYFKELDPASHIRVFLQVYLDNAADTARNILGMARQSLIPFTSNDAISSILSNNDFDIEKIIQEKTVIFLCVPDETNVYNCIVSMFIEQLYIKLIEVAGEFPEQRLPIRFNIVLDEFANFPKMPRIEEMISACRSRNIRMTFVVQTLSQLKSRYGTDTMKVILVNCSNSILFSSREKEMLEFFSDLCGNDEKGRPILQPDRLRMLSKEEGEALVIFDRSRPFITNLSRFSEWASPPVGWTPIEQENVLKPLVKVDVKKGLLDMYGLDMEYSSLNELEEIKQSMYRHPGDSKLISAVNNAIRACTDPTDADTLAYDMIEEFVFFEDNKEDITAKIDQMKSDMDYFDKVVKKAYLKARKIIESLDQEHLEAIRSIIDED